MKDCETSYNCKIWKVKNEALKFLASKKEESESNAYVLAFLEECKPIL